MKYKRVLTNHEILRSFNRALQNLARTEQDPTILLKKSIKLYRQISLSLSHILAQHQECTNCHISSCCQSPIHILDIEFSDIGKKLGLKNPHLIYSDRQKKYETNISCPLLKDNRCSIYQHRPAVCMRVIPKNILACEKQQSNGKNIDLISSGRQLSAILQDNLHQQGIQTRLIDFIATIKFNKS